MPSVLGQDTRTALVCMAYGSPRDEATIGQYYTHIRGGRPPSPEALAELVARYRAIGGSPLAAITGRQAEAVGALVGLPAFVGMKHSPPFVAETVAAVCAQGYERVIGLVMAPHYARMSLGAYEQSLRQGWELGAQPGAAGGPGPELLFIPGFHDHPAFIAALRTILAEAISERRPDRLFFTAHSLPARILAEGDPYRDQLDETCRLLAASMELPPWEFAFQSRSSTGEPWLGPDVLEAIAASAAERVLVCPLGFVADHLEILFDLDIEAQEFARARGIEIRRTASFNDRPDFVQALAEVVRDALVGAGARG